MFDPFANREIRDGKRDLNIEATEEPGGKDLLDALLNNVDFDTQLRFANVTSQQATVHVSIGGVEMAGSPFTLVAGVSTRKSFPAVNSGPVKSESNVKIVAAQRVLYKVNGVDTSFSEMMGLPGRQLNTTYWFPWYNHLDLDSQLRFGVP